MVPTFLFLFLFWGLTCKGGLGVVTEEPREENQVEVNRKGNCSPQRLCRRNKISTSAQATSHKPHTTCTDKARQGKTRLAQVF